MDSTRHCSCLLVSFTYFLSFLLPHTVMEIECAPMIVQSHFDIICRNILNLDCAVFTDSSVNCGTDGVTYNNSCEFAQGHCRSATLHVQHRGACVSGSGSGTPLAAGLTVVLQLVCDDVVHVDCTGQPRVVLCASDGSTYHNNCFFEKARCQRFKLHVTHAGRC
ncbi:tomoregulin-1-like [Littorina saxatilis]|uniref:tomoregulin-1-like n=1 Tax=Littorina saxatilis TaxID=31220 RepID=UPI0038B60B62